MDPTAPKDDPNQNNPTSPPPPASPIEPGQFVVAPKASPDESLGGPAADTTIPPPAEPQSPPPEETLQPPQPASTQRGEFAQTPQGPAPQSEPEPLFAQNQPDPTPFVAPTPPPESAAQTEVPSSRIQSARKILIIVGLLLLVGILGAIVWLFIVGRSRNLPTKTQSQEVTVSQEPSLPPIPKRTTGGFADLPTATRESQATASASPKTGE